MKIPTIRGELCVRGNQKASREACMVALSGAVEALPMDTLEQEKREDRPELVGEEREWEFSKGKKVKLGANMEKLLH